MTNEEKQELEMECHRLFSYFGEYIRKPIEVQE